MTSHPPYLASKEGFVLRAPLVTAAINLRAIYAISANDVWVVGGHGLVLHHDGNAWRRVRMPDATIALHGVWGRGHDDVWVVGGGGRIFHVVDDLVQTEQLSTVKVTLNAIHGLDDGQVWAVGDLGTIVHRSTTGVWGTVTSGVSFALRGVYAVSSSTIWATGDSTKVLRFDGATWKTLGAATSSFGQAVYARSADNAWLAVRGGVSHFDGIQWSMVGAFPPETPAPDIRGVHGDGKGLWAVGGSEIFSRLEAKGIWHSAINYGQGVAFSAVHRAFSVTYACGENGLFAFWRGASWRRLSRSGSNLATVSRAGGRVWVGGVDGYVAYDDGYGWREVAWKPGIGGSVTGIWSADVGKTWVINDRGIIARYDEKARIMEQEHDTVPALNAIWGASSPSLEIWAVGNDGTVLFSKGDGIWESRSTGTDHVPWRGIWGSSASHVFAVGGYGKVAHYDGTSWSRISIDKLTLGNLHAVGGRSKKDVWVVGDGGLVWHFDGMTWSSLGGTDSAVAGQSLRGVYVTPSGRVWMVAISSAKIFSYSPIKKKWKTYSTVGQYALHSIWGAGEDDIWVAGNGGRVFHLER